MRKSWSLCALALLACSAGFEANDSAEAENVARASDRIVLSSTPNCTVEMTKIDYDQVGSDGNDYIELKVTKKGGGVVTTLLDCGIGAIALYDDSSVITPGVCVPYSLTALANVTLPVDGYIEVGQGAGSTVAATIALGSGADGWIHNGRGEIAILSSALSDGLPTSWFQFEGAAKCNALALPVTQIPTENDNSPNFTNVSCDSTFHLVNAADALPKTNADCPSGGAGGGGNAGGAGNAGNAGNAGGAGKASGGANAGGAGGAGASSGGTAGLVGSGGSLNLSGASGSLNSGGNGGAGPSNLAGNAGVANGNGTSGAGGDSTAPGGDAGAGVGVGGSGDSTSNGEAGEAGEANPAQGGRDSETGGSSSVANAGTAAVGDTAGASGNKGHGTVTQGGGCACSVPSAPHRGRAQALIALGALLGLRLRRRRQVSN